MFVASHVQTGPTHLLESFFDKKGLRFRQNPLQTSGMSQLYGDQCRKTNNQNPGCFETYLATSEKILLVAPHQKGNLTEM